jgi:hypothetical protein
MAQIAERGGVAFAAREEVLVDAEYGGAARRMHSLNWRSRQ